MPVTYRLDPGTTTYPGSTTYPGLVGTGTVLNVLIDLGNPTGASPNWQYLDPNDIRNFTISRGSEQEVNDVSAGTATVLLDNRDRAFDPNNASSPYFPFIRPMTRFWLQAELDGVQYDLFKGYADSFDMSWPEKGKDQTTEIRLSDELKILNLEALPVTDPPRDTYRDLVMSDDPSGYWPCNGPQTGEIPAEVDSSIISLFGTLSSYTTGPILGDFSETGNYSVAWNAGANGGCVGGWGATAENNPVGDLAGLGQFTVETWMTIDNVATAPSSTFMLGPLSSTDVTKWELRLGTSGEVSGFVRVSGGTTFTVTGPPLSGSTWYHVVLTLNGGNLSLVINGTIVASTAWSGSFDATLSSGAQSTLTLKSVNTASIRFAHVAFYRAGFTLGRIQAHYTAGTARGFPSQSPGDRVNAALDLSSSVAPRVIASGTRTMTPGYQHGQPPLEAIKAAVEAEALGAMFFSANDGTITFMTQVSVVAPAATFGDTSGLPYQELQVNPYSDLNIVNEWTANRKGGFNQTVSDGTSQGKYFRRAQVAAELELVNDSDVSAILTALLAATKDPSSQIVGITLNTYDPLVAAAALNYDLGTTIRVIRTPMGGGSAIQQDLLIRKIDITGDPSQAWTVTWGLSKAWPTIKDF